MVLLIAGASHTGKTALAQKLLQKYGYPYLSIDHLKMGLIRSHYTALTPESDDQALTDYLWPIVREMIKTAIENGQNLIVEGCYIPFDWAESFEEAYRRQIKYRCLVMTREYIEAHWEDIQVHADTIEKRDDSGLSMEVLIRENEEALNQCRRYGAEYVLIDGVYPAELTPAIDPFAGAPGQSGSASE